MNIIYSESNKLCDNCNKETDSTSIIRENFGYESWCKDCADVNSFKCITCSKLFSNNVDSFPMTVKNDFGLEEKKCCKTCFYESEDIFTCHECHKNYFENEVARFNLRGDRSVCEICDDKNLVFGCVSCGGYFNKSSFGGELRNRKYCNNCWASIYIWENLRSSDSDVLNEAFGLNVPENLRTSKEPFIGVELEVQMKKDTASEKLVKIIDETIREVEDAGKWGLCKIDSSVSRGFEIVTVPMLLDQQKEILVNNFISKNLDSFSNETTDCGIHIHLNRNSLSHIGLARLIFFIYADINREFIIFISERKPNMYWNLQLRDTIKKTIQTNNFLEKAEALNLMHSNTVEFRMFKSFFSTETMNKNLEFVSACQKFCNEEMFILPKYQNFIKWINNNSSSYGSLINFINNSKIFKESCNLKKRAQLQELSGNIFYSKGNDGSVFIIDEIGNSCFITKDGKKFNLCGDDINMENKNLAPIGSMLTGEWDVV